MKLNSPAALKLGRDLLNQYGDWAAVDKAGKRRPDGIIVVPLKASTTVATSVADRAKK